MTLQAQMEIKYDNCSYTVAVKSIVLKGVYYFFINDNEQEPALLSGQTLELVYTDNFRIAPSKESLPEEIAITPDKISVIQNTLLQNKQLWYT